MDRLGHRVQAWLPPCSGSMLASMLACYGPNPEYQGLAGESSSSATTTLDTSISTSTSTSTTSEEAELGTTDTSETDTDTTDTSDPIDPTCGDGNADPGEFCFEFSELLATATVQALAAADFDGDSNTDLAVARKDDVLVLLADGSGGFPLQVDLPQLNGNYRGAAAGDLDGDLVADLVVANENADALLSYRSLGGEFAVPMSYPTGDQPHRLRLADVDGDLRLDAIVTLRAENRVAILLGNDDGGFSEPVSFATNGNDPIEHELGLFDANAGFDLVVGNFEGKQLAILHDAGPAQFAAPIVHKLSGKPRSAQIADFDRDGAPDVAAALEDVDRVEFLFGNGLGDVGVPALAVPVGGKPVGALATDLNGDLAVDMLILNFDDESVGVLFNDPVSPGDFTPHQTLVWFDGFANMTTIISADLNGDDVLDVVVGGDGVRAMLSDP
jgi:hypothetical protein